MVNSQLIKPSVVREAISSPMLLSCGHLPRGFDPMCLTSCVDQSLWLAMDCRIVRRWTSLGARLDMGGGRGEKPAELHLPGLASISGHWAGALTQEASRRTREEAAIYILYWGNNILIRGTGLLQRH